MIDTDNFKRVPDQQATALATKFCMRSPASCAPCYARHTRVDHLVMGARGIPGVRRLLGSVSARVVAEAPCAETVVRVVG